MDFLIIAFYNFDNLTIICQNNTFRVANKVKNNYPAS